ncbi:hypothetical protein ACF1AO_35350 [Streptomyces longwoodensis]
MLISASTLRRALIGPLPTLRTGAFATDLSPALSLPLHAVSAAAADHGG